MTFLGGLALASFGSMRPLAGLGAVQPGPGRTYWPAVNVSIAGCTPPRNYSAAPGRYIQLAGNLQNALHIAFPKGFFDYQKEELRAMRDNRPGGNASAEARALWALDAWARIQWALYALNIPLGPYYVRNNPGPCQSKEGACSWTEVGVPDIGVLARIKRKQKEFNAGVDQRIAAGKRQLDFEFMNAGIRDRIKEARKRPAPFMEMSYEWWGTRGRDQPYVNNLRFMVGEQCIPWMVGGDRLPSKGGKDSDFAAANAGNPTMMRAIRQWRLWSTIDYFPWSTYRRVMRETDTPDQVVYDYAPRFMGRIDDRATLEQYLTRVRNEPSSAQVVGTEAGWYPTLQYTIDYGLPRLIDVITSTDYEAEIREHVEHWAQASKPPMDAAGNIETWYAGPRWGTQPKQLPLTCEDFNDATKGRRDAIEQRAHASIERPGDQCADADSDFGRRACEELADMNAYLEDKFPVAGWMFDLQRYIAHGLISLVGMAEGVSYVPYRVMQHPFTRNLADPVFSTAATGSTKDVLVRITSSLFNIEKQLGLQLEPWTMGPPPPPARTRCDETRRGQDGVMRCVSTVPADCHEIYFDEHGDAGCLSRFTPEQWGAASPANVANACSSRIDQALRQVGGALSPADREKALQTCAAESEGRVAAGQTERLIAQMVQKGNVPMVVVPSAGPKIPWVLIGAAALGVVLYRRT